MDMLAGRLPTFLAGTLLGVLLAWHLGDCEAAAGWCWELVVVAGGVWVVASEGAVLALGAPWTG